MCDVYNDVCTKYQLICVCFLIKKIKINNILKILLRVAKIYPMIYLGDIQINDIVTYERYIIILMISCIKLTMISIYSKLLWMIYYDIQNNFVEKININKLMIF